MNEADKEILFLLAMMVVGVLFSIVFVALVVGPLSSGLDWLVNDVIFS